MTQGCSNGQPMNVEIECYKRSMCENYVMVGGGKPSCRYVSQMCERSYEGQYEAKDQQLIVIGGGKLCSNR